MTIGDGNSSFRSKNKRFLHKSARYFTTLLTKSTPQKRAARNTALMRITLVRDFEYSHSNEMVSGYTVR
jgi:hypothetical protein